MGMQISLMDAGFIPSDMYRIGTVE
jgi:hypothetical protein